MQNAVLEVLIPKWMLPKKSFGKFAGGCSADWVFVRFKDVDEYNRISYVESKRYRVAVFKDEEGVYHECYRPLHPEKKIIRCRERM